MGYKIYGDMKDLKPASDWQCQIGGSYDTLEQAVEAARSCGYYYVEIKLPSGAVIPVPEEREQGPINFLLFAGENYYPRGGYNDLIAKASTEDELREIISENENKARYGTGRFQWWQIVNANTHVVVDEGSC